MIPKRMTNQEWKIRKKKKKYKKGWVKKKRMNKKGLIKEGWIIKKKK